MWNIPGFIVRFDSKAKTIVLYDSIHAIMFSFALEQSCRLILMVFVGR